MNFNVQFAQELVINGDFENNSACPSNPTTDVNCPSSNNTICLINPWQIPDNGSGTSDYFHSCGDPIVGVPQNGFGFQDAHSGNGYVGMFLYSTINSEYKEYIQVRLSTALKQNEEYLVSFYVSLADNFSKYGISEIGLYLSQSPPTGGGILLDAAGNFGGSGLYFSQLNLQPQIKSQINVADYSNWTQICGVYKASGGEEYLTIGSFTPNQNISLANGNLVVSNPSATFPFIYYYVDDVSVRPKPSLSQDTTICTSNYQVLVNNVTSMDIFTWMDGSSNSYNTFSETGTYWVDIETNTCLNYRDSITLNFEQVNISLGNDVLICDHNNPISINAISDTPTISYLWNTNAITSSIQVNQSGNYSVIAYNGICPEAFDTIKVDYRKVDVSIGNDTIICTNDPIPIIASSSTLNVDYVWNTGSISDTLWINSTGEYSVIASNSVCPNAFDTIQLNNAKVNVQLAADTLICGESTGFILFAESNTPFVNFVWNNGLTNQEITVDQSANYSVTASNGLCPNASDSIFIQFVKENIPDIPSMEDLECPEGFIQLETKLTNFMWSTGEISNIILIDKPGTYWLEAINSPCENFRDSILIIDKRVDPQINVPNIFTPNNDGKNDLFSFQIENGDVILNFHLQIFNRWGHLIFETYKQTEFWNGNINDHISTEGTYFWKINYTTSCNDQEIITKQGFLELVH